MSNQVVASQVQQAQGQIRIALLRAASRYPFHAKVLERFQLFHRPSVRTMAVAPSKKGILLLYDEAFVLSIRLDELVGVLLHEVHHVVFRHLLADRSEYPDAWARVVAEEVTVNEFVAEPLPGQPLLLEQFPKLPPRESTRQRYERLRSVKRRMAVFSPTGAPMAPGAGRATASAKPGTAPITIDEHSVWAESAPSPEQAQSLLRELLHGAAIEAGAAAVPDYLREALVAMGIGRIAGDGTYELAGTRSGTLPWVSLLRSYAGRHLQRRPDFRRPPRRFPELVGVVPGRCRRSQRPKVLAVIDTSGSVTPSLLELISAELGRLAAEFQVTVVECDAAVRAVYPYRPLTTVHGRGGTDLRPPFKPEFLAQHGPDLLIYFTDGFGPAPVRPPRLPVIWCLVPGGKPPASRGRVIRMSTSTANGGAA